MEHYKMTVGIAPTNKYEKAKMDLIQAFKSYSELTPMEKECLAKEIWGAAQVEMAKTLLGMR